jgi:hypothetical protein
VTITLTNDETWSDVDPADPRPNWRKWRRYVGAGLAAALLLAAVVVLVAPHGSSPAPKGAGTGIPVGAGTASPVGVHLVNGIPVGYPRTEAGARAAAVNYRVAWSSTRMFDSTQRRQIIDTTADPASRSGTQGQNDETWVEINRNLGLSADGQPRAGQVLVSRDLPAGAKTVAYSPDVAVVSVWESYLSGVVGTGTTRLLRDGWETATITLRWVNEDWKQSSWSVAQGPTPRTADDAPSDETTITNAVAQYGALSYAG